MAIKNLANYKVGKEYLFTFFNGNGGTESVTVLEKGNRILRLKFKNNDAWFESKDLSIPVKKDLVSKESQLKVKPVVKPVIEKTVMEIAKPVAVEENKVNQILPDHTKDLKPLKVEHDNVLPVSYKTDKEWSKTYGKFLKSLRVMLYNKGYTEVYKLNPQELIKLLEKIVESKS